jgi:hypothetical protein
VANFHLSNITHLREVSRDYEFCVFVQGQAVKGFDSEGIFVAHLNFVGYSNLTGIFTPQEIEGDIGNRETVINTNIKKLKQIKSKTSNRLEEESPS